MSVQMQFFHAAETAQYVGAARAYTILTSEDPQVETQFRTYLREQHGLEMILWRRDTGYTAETPFDRLTLAQQQDALLWAANTAAVLAYTAEAGRRDPVIARQCGDFAAARVRRMLGV